MHVCMLFVNIWFICSRKKCNTSLQFYIDSSASKDCVGSIVNVTVSTNHFYSCDDTIILMVNDRVCNGNSNDSDVVKCDRPIYQSCSFILTAISSGTVTIRACTNYCGASCCSDDIELPFVSAKNCPKTACKW